MNGAMKNDEDKNPLGLLPFGALEQIGLVLKHGAEKYEDHNWRKGLKFSRLISALLRHIFAWVRGEENDAETGLNHLAHAGCELLFLLSYRTIGGGLDDRQYTNSNIEYEKAEAMGYCPGIDNEEYQKRNNFKDLHIGKKLSEVLAQHEAERIKENKNFIASRVKECPYCRSKDIISNVATSETSSCNNCKKMFLSYGTRELEIGEYK